MKSHRLSTIVYAQGFIDEHIKTHNDFLDDTESDAYREQVQQMWQIVSEGLDQLRAENTSLENKLALIDLARNTPT
jgi:DNA polymerase III gamma/tau subunit